MVPNELATELPIESHVDWPIGWSAQLLMHSVAYLLALVPYLCIFAVTEFSVKMASKSNFVKSFFGDKYNDYLKILDFMLASLVNSTVSSIYVIMYLYNYDTPNSTSLEYLKPIFLYCMAYCIYDLCLIFKHYTGKIDDYFYIVHHVTMFTILLTRLTGNDQLSTHLVANSLTMEFSTIWLNISLFLYRTGFGHTRLFYINSWITVIAFGYVRVLRFPYILYQYYVATKYPPLAGLVFVVLNTVWFYKIAGYHWQFVVSGKKKKV
jgi:hypothetical protein